MLYRLAPLMIALLLSSLGQIRAQAPCPCQPGAAESSDKKVTEQQRAPTEVNEIESTILACPCYKYANHGSYCSWYAMRCDGGAVSIDLPCDQTPASCGTPSNCVTIPAGFKKTSTEFEKPPVQLDILPLFYVDPDLDPPFAELERHDLVKIEYEPEEGDAQTIFARINRVRLGTESDGDDLYLGATLLHGHEVDATGYGGKWHPIPPPLVKKTDTHELRVKFKGNFVSIVTHTSLN